MAPGTLYLGIGEISLSRLLAEYAEEEASMEILDEYHSNLGQDRDNGIKHDPSVPE